MTLQARRSARALIALRETSPTLAHVRGGADVDPVRHLIGAAIAWGGNPERAAIYLNVTPSQTDGETVHELRVAEVPVDAFWSISVYNADGYFEPNERDADTLNNPNATREQFQPGVIGKQLAVSLMHRQTGS